jgi:hypothetical protein
MGSWIVELQRREAAAGERVDGLRRQIAELTERLAAEENLLSRLEITRETMSDLLAESGEAGGEEATAAGGSPIGVVTVPAWRPGLDVAVLPVAYRDVLEVLADAGRPLRAGQIADAVGLGGGAAKVEGLRSKLKRLAGRGWLSEQVPGLFAAAGTAQAGGQPPVAQPSDGVEEVGSSS